MDKWLKKFSDPAPQNCTDNTDRFRIDANMSVLSVPSKRLLGQNWEHISGSHTDNTDRLDPKTNVSVLSVTSQGTFDEDSNLYDFEERLAIAECDGYQTSHQAHRIVYLDAFISLLSTLAENDPYQDWLAEKIQTVLETLETQHLPTHH